MCQQEYPHKCLSPPRGPGVLLSMKYPWNSWLGEAPEEKSSQVILGKASGEGHWGIRTDGLILF
jgi:hypothetical protein